MYCCHFLEQSKRIGHFFFWYLRSEVAGCPFFRQRMAVILEAYLLGCGEAMLTEFQHQVQVVNCLHDVALTVKVLYPERTDLPSTGKVQTTLPSVLCVIYAVHTSALSCMCLSAPQKLQELLEECNLPSDFLVPFDPRVRAGSIIVS